MTVFIFLIKILFITTNSEDISTSYFLADIHKLSVAKDREGPDTIILTNTLCKLNARAGKILIILHSAKNATFQLKLPSNWR